MTEDQTITDHLSTMFEFVLMKCEDPPSEAALISWQSTSIELHLYG